MLLGVADDLSRRVEAHRLAVDERRGKGGRMVPLQPRRDVHQQGEAGGMRFGKAVFAEPLDLLEAALGELAGVAAVDHAAHQAPPEPVDLVALALPGGHGPAKLIGLVGGEAGGHDRQGHRLLLKEWHAQGLAEHPLHVLARIGHRLLAVAAAQIGMNHVPLDRPGPNDRHLDHEVVEAPRPQPRQHRHLGPGLDLEHPDGVGGADHVVDGGVFGRDRVERKGLRVFSPIPFVP